MDAQLKALLKETVKFEAFSGAVDSYGEPSFSTSITSVAARVQASRKFVIGPDGQQVLAPKTIIVAGTSASITERDHLWLPGESTANDQPWAIASVQTCIGEDGTTDYRRITLQGR